MDKNKIPFTLEFAIELPEDMIIESPLQGQDCTTDGPPPHCDDD